MDSLTRPIYRLGIAKRADRPAIPAGVLSIADEVIE